ncbi:alpha-amylase family glycosyl hydrolase [Pseudonocardia adelaidensis]|uniref:Alpha-amylase family protein n=1 Tax=Pseudonocardia adelaidensis TaxID=648754 RepID=A0ABP9NPG9_9PSEU
MPAEPAWVHHAIWWQVYPLGFVGAHPGTAATPGEHRLRRIVAWLDHAVELGASGIALGPIFASSSHGYDTVDHFRIDPRLGDDADFDLLVAEAHGRGLRVQLDGVFNHVGREHPRAQAAIAAGPGSPGASWLATEHGPEGLRFATFEGHDALLALNQADPGVEDLVVRVMVHWLDRGADAWRLDAAYAVPPEFWARVLPRVRARHPDAWYVAEVIHGDYQAFVEHAGVDSVTQYELWKAIWSSINDRNFFELDWALSRHGRMLESFVPATFVGNHDVTRIATRITDPRHLAHALVLLATLGGTPTIYAGDEYGMHGVKEDRSGGDDAIRTEFAATGPAGAPDGGGDAAIYRLHQRLIGLRRRHAWLHLATTAPVELRNEQYVYEAVGDGHRLLVALNLGDHPFAPAGTDGQPLAADDDTSSYGNGSVAPHGWAIWNGGA